MKLARHTSQPNFNSILYLPQLFDIIVTWLLTDRQECCRNKYQAACCCTRIVIECNNFQGRGPIRSNLRQYQQRMFFMKRKSMARVRESVLSDGEWSVCLMFFDMWCGSLRGRIQNALPHEHQLWFLASQRKYISRIMNFRIQTSTQSSCDQVFFLDVDTLKDLGFFDRVRVEVYVWRMDQSYHAQG